MNNYSLDDEKNKHPYKFYGSVLEEKHGDGLFLMRSALEYVVDSYDPVLNSVEQSHYDDLGYFEVINFSLPDSFDVLDLTWMKKNDIFCLQNNQQFKNINEIRVNIDNLGYSSLPVDESLVKRLLLVVNGADSKSSVVQQIKNFVYFIRKNSACLSGIRFEGFSSVVETLLTLYAQKCGVDVYEQEISKNK